MHGSESIKIIAAGLFFLSPVRFSNWFRHRNQYSTREYRNLAKEAK